MNADHDELIVRYRTRLPECPLIEVTRTRDGQQEIVSTVYPHHEAKVLRARGQA